MSYNMAVELMITVAVAFIGGLAFSHISFGETTRLKLLLICVLLYSLFGLVLMFFIPSHRWVEMFCWLALISVAVWLLELVNSYFANRRK
jgi:phosphatidylserine synthase